MSKSSFAAMTAAASVAFAVACEQTPTAADSTTLDAPDIRATYVGGPPSNDPPDCSAAAASPDELSPPNHKFVSIDIVGVTDPDGDAITITIDAIFQDEPVDTFGDGSSTPDGTGVGTDNPNVRAERTGTPRVPGDGRVYHISFTADDGNGGHCSTTVTVCVPHDQRDPTCVDQGPLFDSTIGTG